VKNSTIKVLFVDDEKHNLMSFSASFRRDFEVFTANSALEGEKILEENEIPIIIADYKMPGINGIAFLTSVKAKHPETIRILLTAYADIEAVIDSINHCGVSFYITKPWVSEQLETSIKAGFELYEQQKDKDKKLMELDLQIQNLKAKMNYEFEHYKVYIQDNLRTAIKQYLVYFKDYVFQLKKEDIHFEVRSVADGLEIELSKYEDARKTSEYLAEYLSYLHMADKEQINISVNEKDADKKVWIETRMKTEIRHLQNSLDLERYKVTYLKDTLKKVANFLDTSSQHSLYYKTPINQLI